MQPLSTRYPIRPKKKLGQNFLTDDAVLRREVACADIAGRGYGCWKSGLESAI